MQDKLPNLRPIVEDINATSSTVKIFADKTFYSEAAGKIEPYKSLPKTMKPALERVGNYVRASMIPRVFEQEGPGWAPLARRTISDREKLGFQGPHPILQRSRDLFKELTQKSHPHHVEIIRTGKNARIEIGGSSAKFIENQGGRKEARLPKRSMIPGTRGVPIKDRDRTALQDIIIRAVKKKTS